MDKRAKGHNYREATLRALARLGYASTRQLARLLHKQCTESTRKMTGRTLGWLHERGYIVTKRDGDSVAGELLAAITVAGAARLAEIGEPLPYGKAHARNWLRHSHSHRTACNSVYAALYHQSTDFEPWSELEVRAGLAPVCSFAYQLDSQSMLKVPDLVMETDNGLEWVETENSWRSDKDMTKMLACMHEMFWRPGGQIARVHFVVAAPGARNIGRRLRQALTHGPSSGYLPQRREVDNRILAQHVVVSMLDHERLELTPVAL
jgi:hypothetical protein